MMVRQRAIGGMGVRMLCALALLLLGLAHRIPAPETVRLELGTLAFAYQLPDGSLPDLCMPAGKKPALKGVQDCDACRLSASVILPSPPRIQPPAYPIAQPCLAAEASSLPGKVLERAQSARGPPDVSRA